MNRMSYCGEGNARLISAAPELAEALATMVQILSDVIAEGKDIDRRDGSPLFTEGDAIQVAKARAALTKAKGEA